MCAVASDMETSRASYYLQPGFIYFTKEPAIVRTVLGSCVAVCLWDKTLLHGGMNHFMKPATHDKAQATPIYGNVAVAALVRMMIEAGSERGDLVAQILGGAAHGGAPDNHIGQQNIHVARLALARRQVAIVAEDVGGSIGRKIAFDTGSGQLAVLKVHSLREGDWLD